MGNGPFAVPAFEAIHQTGDHEILAVWTRPVRTGKSRGGPPTSPVRDWAESRRLPNDAPESVNDVAAAGRLAAMGADLLVVCDFGQILSSETLATTRLGGINLHGSLLPKYRGAAPVQWAVLNGDAETGVSVLHMTPRLDGGPVLTDASTAIGRGETAGELEQRLSVLGVEPTLRAIGMLDRWDRQSPIGRNQDSGAVTKAPRLAKSDGEIDWGRDAAEIDHHVCGMQPWPGAFTFFKPKPDKPPIRLVIRRVEPTDDPVGEECCGVWDLADGLRIAAADRWVKVLEMQPAGKKPMSGEAFMRGHQPPEGSRFYS